MADGMLFRALHLFASPSYLLCVSALCRFLYFYDELTSFSNAYVYSRPFPIPLRFWGDRRCSWSRASRRYPQLFKICKTRGNLHFYGSGNSNNSSQYNCEYRIRRINSAACRPAVVLRYRSGLRLGAHYVNVKNEAAEALCLC
ncbi:hypothetical protein Trydic_g20036 [Trypoxylus dichotomus]